MIIVLCVDDNMGLAFNRRRQSKDAALREKLASLSGGQLRMSEYSARQFDIPVYSGPDYLSAAAPGDWCFCEDTDFREYAGQIERIYLFRWNRVYPADLYFSFPGQWRLISSEDFPGTSHEKITLEVYDHES